MVHVFHPKRIKNRNCQNIANYFVIFRKNLLSIETAAGILLTLKFNAFVCRFIESSWIYVWKHQEIYFYINFVCYVSVFCGFAEHSLLHTSFHTGCRDERLQASVSPQCIAMWFMMQVSDKRQKQNRRKIKGRCLTSMWFMMQDSGKRQHKTGEKIDRQQR